MIYFERDQDHYIMWPVLAISSRGEFWISACWLNCEVGWRSGKVAATVVQPQGQ